MKAKVNFEIKIDGVSESDFKEWLEFELGLRDDIRVENELEYAELREQINKWNTTIAYSE